MPLFTHSLSTHLALSTRSLSTRSLIAAIEGECRTWLIDTYPHRTRTRSLQMISLSPTIHSPNPNQTAEDDDQPISRRIQRLSLYLNPSPIHPDRQVIDALELQSCASKTKLSVSTQQLSNYMRGKHRDIQERVFEYFNSRPDLQTPVEISKDDHRELCMRQLLGLVRETGIRPFRYVVDDPSKYFAIAEAVGSVDMSLGIKMGVQYSSSLKKKLYKPSFAGFVNVDLAQNKLSLRSLIDNSVVESFGAGGKTCITSRVYPTLAVFKDAHLYVFNNDTETVTVENLDAWSMNYPLMN